MMQIMYDLHYKQKLEILSTLFGKLGNSHFENGHVDLGSNPDKNL